MLAAIAAVIGLGCNRSLPPVSPAREPKPSILLITLDTTRADAIGPDAAGVETPAFNAIAARGRRFRHAYATVPETLPSHSSMMTGLYPAGHGVHQNARYLPASFPVVAERLQHAGYRTSAFVSSFVLARRFGLARGFDVYNDEQPAGQSERAARETTDAAVAELQQTAGKPRFMWVHYYDPHAPFAPPEPFRTRYAASPYLGEVAAMDEQIGRLTAAFERYAPAPVAIAIVADHGEGLGDHGEAGHGHLLYQSTMRVPLVLAGPGIAAGVSDTPVSVRRVFHTILDWAGLGGEHSLRGAHEEVVLAEGMKPFLEYGWLPQVMGVSGRHKAILAGRLEAYDVVADPAETRNLGSGAGLPASLREAIEDYPVPTAGGASAPAALDEDAKRRLASLGYVGGGAAPVVRTDAPRPADMTALFPTIERAGALFVAGNYEAATPQLQLVLASDPYNLDAALRLATAYSSLGQDAKAVAMFTKAAAIAPGSQDVRTYLALHYARGKDWERAVPLLELVVAETPERLTAVEALARLRARQGQAAMNVGKTADALAAFERARALNPSAFTNDLELGVLYLAVRRFADARAALDRALATRPNDAMALFKRAQVSVLLNEADKLERIATAREKADKTTQALIDRERLFR
jgi:arylsulfatase A-like enzyme/tetratricopeptide (TPR) repeat protein